MGRQTPDALRCAQSLLRSRSRSRRPPARGSCRQPEHAGGRARDHRRRIRAAEQGPDRAQARAPTTGSRCRSAPTSSTPIEVGDRLRVSGEVQVSTTCVDPGPRCVGHPLRDQPDGDRADRALAEPEGRLGLPAAVARAAPCSASSGARIATTTARSRSRTPRPRSPTSRRCPARPTACYVNLIVGAHEPEGEARQQGRPRRRPARRLGRAGQGPAQRRPGARRRSPAPTVTVQQRARQRRRCR